ncbi:hypothetical protein [Moorena producens]|uniref:hypothetical protein n=1 Tax=Moorena producens TaxID=1155739 RepID=UPI0011EA711A|nr:hypothetical protein [Moorena producens]
MQSLMGETTAVAHGGDHGSRSWGEPPRPRCLPKTALPSQDRANHAITHYLLPITLVQMFCISYMLPTPVNLKTYEELYKR